MRTREHRTEDHDHPDQPNSDPTTPGGAVLRDALRVPSDVPRDEQRTGWSPRIVDPRTITTSRTTDL